MDRDLLPFPGRSDFDLVGLDNMARGFLVAEHLIKLGCRKLFFVARPFSAATVDARIAGVREAIVRHRIEPVADWVHFGDPADLKFVRSLVAGRQADAFICANDDTAAVLLRSWNPLVSGCLGLSGGGLRRRQIRHVGFAPADHRPPTLPGHRRHRFSRHAGAPGRASTSGPEHLLTPHLVVRESCGAYLPHPKTA